eukprot:3833127-Amphidinium_carterae.1
MMLCEPSGSKAPLLMSEIMDARWCIAARQASREYTSMVWSRRWLCLPSSFHMPDLIGRPSEKSCFEAVAAQVLTRQTDGASGGVPASEKKCRSMKGASSEDMLLPTKAHSASTL